MVFIFDGWLVGLWCSYLMVGWLVYGVHFCWLVGWFMVFIFDGWLVGLWCSYLMVGWLVYGVHF